MSVAACPRCEGQVTLPPSAPPTAQVKCPLCEEEFALSEVYDKLPPMLVLIEAPVEAHTVTEGGMLHGAGEFDNLFVPSAEANGEGEFHLSPVDGEEGESTFDFGGSGGGTAVATAPATKAAPARAKRPPKSPVKEGIKIVLGGIVGLAAGYMILLWGFNRDLCSDVAGKPVAKVLPAWMHWALPAAHKPAAPAAAAPAADDDPSEAGEDQSDADSPDAAADASPTDDGTTGTDETASDASDDPSQSPPEDTSKSPTDEGSDDASASPPRDDMPSDVATEDKPADETTPKQPAPRANDDGGFEIKPTQPSFEVDEPPLDFPPPSAVPPVDEPKLTDPLPGDQPLMPTDEPPVVDTPGDEPPPSDDEPKVETPASPPADAPADDNPFDIPPGSVDPADKPEVTPADAPTDEPAKPEPAEPKAGLKIDKPVDDATVVSTRSAATSAVDRLMPADPAAKAAFTREKYASYTKLCEFADSVSRVAVVENDPNVAAASAMMQMIVADDTDTRSLGQLANAWLSKRRANDGIALAGKVTAVATAGGLTTITVELPALEGRLEARAATIVTREDASIAEGDEVSAVGTVVEKPADAIVGYSGADTQVIWGAWVGRRGG